MNERQRQQLGLEPATSTDSRLKREPLDGSVSGEIDRVDRTNVAAPETPRVKPQDAASGRLAPDGVDSRPSRHQPPLTVDAERYGSQTEIAGRGEKRLVGIGQPRRHELGLWLNVDPRDATAPRRLVPVHSLISVGEQRFIGGAVVRKH